MNYLDHIPWNIAALAVLVIVLGVIFYLKLGKRVGIHVWKGTNPHQVSPIVASSLAVPPPLPARSNFSKTPTKYLMPEQGTEGAASLARAIQGNAGFSAEALLRDVEKTYRGIMGAYGQKDIERLTPLLAPQALEIFKAELEKRAENQETIFCEISSIETIKLLRIIEAPEMPGEDFPFKQRVEVEISSWQVNGAKESSGHIIFGTQGLTHFCERWLFEKGESPQLPWRAMAVESV